MNADALRIPADIDPKSEATLRQHRAGNPLIPVWVEASAGSGKTKVLVDRMLRLMLPSAGRHACSPGTILCITFTKAAAAEVMERVTKRLREWTIAPDTDLHASLTDLLGSAPTAEQAKLARSLFAQVLDTPGGMKIMTIHAFCQSVLARFPLEAGLPSGFEMMDDAQARALMRDVRRTLIAELMQDNADTKLKSAFQYLSALLTIDDLEFLMEKLSGERSRLHDIVTAFGSVDALCDGIDTHLGVEDSTTDEGLIAAFFDALPRDALQAMCPVLQGDNKTNQKYAGILGAALSGPVTLDHYSGAFLKKDGDPYQPNGILKSDPGLLNSWTSECERLQALMQQRKGVYTATCTKSLLRFGIAALDRYEHEKRRRNLSDFEDLIALTKDLLSDGGVHWVQYKLDQGIDHILVDEAQDTNPDQWDIITALYEEFYSDSSMRDDRPRTTFVVGDEKQSIYSFQRADPRIFAYQHDRLDEITKPLQGTEQQTIYLNASFRSGAAILQFVDTVFAPQAMMQGVVRLESGRIEHRAADSGKAAHVEIWPLVKTESRRSKNSDPAAWDDAWVVPGSAVQALAERMATTIKNWLDTGEMLESQGRPIRPADILILLAKRAPLAEPVLRALRAAHIPVTGIDRMVLSDQISVQDALAALSFALAPDDDLILATLLKSPFIGASEQILFDIAHGREGTLWESLRTNRDCRSMADWLSGLIAISGSATPSAFLHHVFYRPCPADNVSGMRAMLHALGSDAIDPLQELLARADGYALSGTAGLQGFLNEAQSDTSEIKRQMDASGNRVRLMTVHGAKGLEAPIVFLPDTIRTNRSKNDVDMLQFPARKPAETTPRKVPLWAADRKNAAPVLTERLQYAIERGEEEYRRLLYVALTRPAERLYIAGAQAGTDGSVDPQSWYFSCADAFDQLKLVQNGDDGIRFIRNAQTSEIKDKQKSAIRAANDVPLPGWAFKSAPAPEFPPKPLMPSKPEGMEPGTLSPLSGMNEARFKRGRLIHTLFQFLPELPANDRRVRASEWLARPVHKLTDTQQHEILDAVMRVLENPGFANLFGPQARAEVPVTGMMGNTVVSGQIDRLMVADDEIVILDYKTNRPAPATREGVSPVYKTQLRLYRDLLKKVYPNKDIRAVLLWTDGPRLMDMTLDL